MTSKVTYCEVHNEPLLIGRSPVRYGIPKKGTPEQRYAYANLFPNSFFFVGGGCVRSKQHPKSKAVMYCPRCRATEMEWEKTHRDNEQD